MCDTIVPIAIKPKAIETYKILLSFIFLYADKDKALKIGSTPNQDNPLMDVSDIKGFPLLGLDVWEHAYYLRYQNKRADYIANWWKVVNWNFIEDRYQSVV